MGLYWTWVVRHIDSILVGKIQEQYKDWKTYVKTIEHYLNYKTINQG